MSIGSRVKEAIDKLNQDDPINAAIQISIAVDGTSKNEYPGQKPTDRCKRFLRDNQGFITWYVFSGAEFTGDFYLEFAHADIKSSSSGKSTLEEILYHIVRCSLLHEGELSDSVIFTERPALGLHGGKVLIPIKYLWGIILAVIAAKSNSNESLPDEYTITSSKRQVGINELWGDQKKMREIISDDFKV